MQKRQKCEEVEESDFFEPRGLLRLCSAEVGKWIRKKDLDRIPDDLYEPLQRQMSKERQKDVFDQVKKWFLSKPQQLEKIEHWKGWKKHGESRGYMRNGNLWWVSHWKNGQQHGESRGYLRNGQLWYLYNRKNGKKKHGIWKDWYLSGRLKSVQV